MLLPRALLAPHLPTLLLDEQRGHCTPMIAALGLEAARLAAERPDIVLVIDAHWQTRGHVEVADRREHRTITDEPVFGVEARYDCPGHPGLARAIVEAGRAAGMRVGAAQRGVDRGVSVPLHFLVPSRAIPVVPVSVADGEPAAARAWGAVLRRVLLARPERVAVVVGGMLSHATHAWHFRREVPEAVRLDREILEALAAGRWEPPAFRGLDKARPEAGLRHLEVLRGVLGADVAAEPLCYEGAHGMGAALLAFEVPEGTRLGPPPAEIALDSPLVWPPVPRRRPPATGAPRRRTAASRRGPAATPSSRPRPARSRPAASGGRVSAGRRTPTPRGRARGPRPGPKRRG